MIAESSKRNWEQIIPFYSFAPEVRKIIYTTNAIDCLRQRWKSSLENWNQ
jgi:putative transposase